MWGGAARGARGSGRRAFHVKRVAALTSGLVAALAACDAGAGDPDPPSGALDPRGAKAAADPTVEAVLEDPGARAAAALRSRDPEVRRVAIALRALDADVPALSRALRDPSREVRRQAARGLLGRPGVAPGALRGALAGADGPPDGALVAGLAVSPTPGLGPAAWRWLIEALSPAALADACRGVEAAGGRGAAPGFARALGARFEDPVGPGAPPLPAPCVPLGSRELDAEALDAWLRTVRGAEPAGAAAAWVAVAPGGAPPPPGISESWRLAVVRAAVAEGRGALAAAWAVDVDGTSDPRRLDALLPMAGAPAARAAADRALRGADAAARCAAARLVDRHRGWPGDVDRRCAAAPPGRRWVWNAEAVAAGAGAADERRAWARRALAAPGPAWQTAAVADALRRTPFAGGLPLPQPPRGPTPVPPGLEPRPASARVVVLETTAGPLRLRVDGGGFARTSRAAVDRLVRGGFDGASFRWDDALGGLRVGPAADVPATPVVDRIVGASSSTAFVPGAVVALPGAVGFLVRLAPRPGLDGRLASIGRLEPGAASRLLRSDVLVAATEDEPGSGPALP